MWDIFWLYSHFFQRLQFHSIFMFWRGFKAFLCEFLTMLSFVFNVRARCVCVIFTFNVLFFEALDFLENFNFHSFTSHTHEKASDVKRCGGISSVCDDTRYTKWKKKKELKSRKMFIILAQKQSKKSSRSLATSLLWLRDEAEGI